MFNYLIALFYNVHHVSPGTENTPRKTQIKITHVIIKQRPNPKYAFGLRLNKFGWKFIVFCILSLFLLYLN